MEWNLSLKDISLDKSPVKKFENFIVHSLVEIPVSSPKTIMSIPIAMKSLCLVDEEPLLTSF